MRAKVEAVLKHEYVSCFNFTHGKQTKTDWETEYGEDVGMFRLKGPIPPTKVIGRRSLGNFFNKPTTFYWAHSTQERDRCRLWPFACIYKEWFRYYDDDPDFSFGHFFANPVQITSTGPKETADICEAHRSLCDRAYSFLHMARGGEAGYAYGDGLVTSYPQDHNLFPLCRAVFIIFDKISPRPGASVSLDTEVQRQNVLLVRTKDEDGLSASITFDTIRSQSLPLARHDINTEDSDSIIRVSLRTAVHFILDLQRREEIAFPDLRRRTSNRSVFADEHVARIMREADKKEINNVSQIDFALQLIQERKSFNGEEFEFWTPSWN